MKKVDNHRFSQVLYKENRCMAQKSVVAAGKKGRGWNLCKGCPKRLVCRDEIEVKT